MIIGVTNMSIISHILNINIKDHQKWVIQVTGVDLIIFHQPQKSEF
jgi:hypothetical protein